ncbi:hypothetical protein DFH28DRAFT_1117797 [Melampsora americana]|nr:hypothetical protein DFH28DRAFT_1117797 [Melampsora americana]
MPKKTASIGHKGHFGLHHNQHKNASCKNHACALCCYLNNNSVGCVPHTSIQNKKCREATSGNGKKPQEIKTTHLDPNVCSQDNNNKRENQTIIPNYAQGPMYQAFQDVSPQDQAKERIDNAAVQLANQTISMIVWAPNSQNQHVPANLWQVVAPQ